MSWHHGHARHVCPEGHVISQCRCMGPKVDWQEPREKCPTCRDQEPSLTDRYVEAIKDDYERYGS